ARGSARYSKTTKIQGDQQRIAVDPIEPNVGSVGRPVRAHAIHMRVCDAMKHSVLQLIAKLCLPPAFRRSVINQPLRRAPKSHSPGAFLRTSAHPAFIPTAIKNRLKLSSLPNVKHADALRRIKLVAADGIKIHPQHLYVDFQLTRSLNAIGMK